MSVRELARALGISKSRVCELTAKGMPADSVESAKAWRLAYVRPISRGLAANNGQAAALVDFAESEGSDGQADLNGTLERLRRLERTTAAAVKRLMQAGRIPEAIALRQQHGAMIRQLFDAELKAVTLARERGELIKLKAAEAMIVAALQEPVMMLRQLPELGRDPEERQRLTAFLNGVLEAMRSGAASACSSGGPTSCS